MEDSLLKQIEAQYKKDLPFAVYRKPNSLLVKAVLQDTNELHTISNFEESGFVMAPFLSCDATIYIPFDRVLESEVEVYEFFSETDAISSGILESHTNLVQQGIEAINEDKFEKVVLSRSETVAHSFKSPINLFKKLLASYTHAFVYLWFHPKVGCWLGATPELLLYTHGKRFKTMALAGTQLHKEDVIWQEKEQQEQAYVTDFIVEELKEISQSLQVTQPYTVQAGKLAHIRTDISGSYSGTLNQLLNKLHPTPAVCGLPKEAAKQFIIENEGYKRAFYTGFLGELNWVTTRRNNARNTENKAYQFSSVSSSLFVNLRCMQYKSNEVILYVGGGITKDSNPEKEFQETVNKSATMKKVLIN